MAVALQLGTAVLSVLVLLSLMAVVRHQARRHGLRPEVQRKLVHIGTGLYALTLPWLFPDRWPVYVLIALTLAVMLVLRMPRFARGGIGETLHGVERRSYGDVLLALAVGVVFLVSDGQAILYVLPIAILTLSDAAAALTGSRYGTRFFQIEAGRKSLEGSVAFFMVTLILSMVCLLLLSEVPRANVILLALIVAAFGTLVEADSWRGFDNFFLPAGLMVFLAEHLNSTPAALIAIMLVFAAAIWAARRMAPALGLTRHAARVYVISAFLLVTVTTLPNTILALLVFVTHAVACRRTACAAEFPELDCVAALALVSFGWLASEEITGLTALPYYGATAMAMSAGFVALALAPEGPALRWAGSAVAALGLVALYLALMRYSAGGLSGVALGAVALAVVPAALRPEAFVTQRAGKVAVLALIVPVAALIWTAARARGWT